MQRLLRALLAFALSVEPALAERFSFAAMGDVPYSPSDEVALQRLIQQIDQRDLAFVLHVGDIKGGGDRCDDSVYESRLAMFNLSKLPFILIPGDNDWSDCHRRSSGRYDPQNRLEMFRRTFYRDDFSVGQQRLPIERQSAKAPFEAFSENMRWSHQNVLFFTLHVVGSDNNIRQPAEHAVRNTANLAWLGQSFANAKTRGAQAVVVALHADPMFEVSAIDPRRDGFAEIIRHLLQEVSAFAKPVLLIHGDGHRFRFDQPLRARGVPRSLTNLTRLEVHGPPSVAWTQIVVDPDAARVFRLAPQ